MKKIIILILCLSITQYLKSQTLASKLGISEEQLTQLKEKVEYEILAFRLIKNPKIDKYGTEVKKVYPQGRHTNSNVDPKYYFLYEKYGDYYDAYQLLFDSITRWPTNEFNNLYMFYKTGLRFVNRRNKKDTISFDINNDLFPFDNQFLVQLSSQNEVFSEKKRIHTLSGNMILSYYVQEVCSYNYLGKVTASTAYRAVEKRLAAYKKSKVNNFTIHDINSPRGLFDSTKYFGFYVDGTIFSRGTVLALVLKDEVPIRNVEVMYYTNDKEKTKDTTGVAYKVHYNFYQDPKLVTDWAPTTIKMTASDFKTGFKGELFEYNNYEIFYQIPVNDKKNKKKPKKKK